MAIVLADDPEVRTNLLPLTFTRPIAGLRIGILTLAEKWEKYLGTSILYYQTEKYLEKKYPPSPEKDNIYINASVCPDQAMANRIKQLQQGESLWCGNVRIAYRNEDIRKIEHRQTFTLIRHSWDLFVNNGAEIRKDFELLCQGRVSKPIQDPHTRVYNPSQIFLEEGVKLRAAILNAEDGPIYLGKYSEVQEGAIIKGPFALCHASAVNMGAKMRGDNTIGPYSKVGGEVSNSIILGYSNKAHDGFMGNSVIGEWCNFGADSNTSNLKNNYTPIKVYSYKTGNFEDSGRQFCGTIMGDHSKCGINSMFDSGTIIGVNVSVYGPDYLPKFLPSFSWYDGQTQVEYRLDKALEVAERVMARRNLVMSETDKEILTHIYKTTTVK